MAEVSVSSLSPSSSSVLSTSSSSFSPSHTKPSRNHNKNSLSLYKPDDEIDEMYNSLRRLSQSTAMSTNRLRRVSPSPIPYRDIQKSLTFTLNEIYFTDGSAATTNEIDSENGISVVGTKKDLYTKLTKSIGTSLKNCETSDMISIDIDPESTRLPLMCKLMIIVEGAAVERGTRVLVRDAAIQVDDEDDDFTKNRLLRVNDKSIPIIRVDVGENDTEANMDMNRNR